MKNNGINYWHGGMVGGGQRWRDVWTAKAEEAVALVFIISATFMESQACQRKASEASRRVLESQRERLYLYHERKKHMNS